MTRSDPLPTQLLLGPTPDDITVVRDLAFHQWWNSLMDLRPQFNPTRRERLMEKWREAETPGTRSWTKIQNYFWALGHENEPKRGKSRSAVIEVKIAVSELETPTFTSGQLVVYLNKRFPCTRWNPSRVGGILSHHKTEFGIALIGRDHNHNHPSVWTLKERMGGVSAGNGEERVAAKLP